LATAGIQKKHMHFNKVGVGSVGKMHQLYGDLSPTHQHRYWTKVIAELVESHRC